MLKKYLETGKIVNTHGIKGEVRIQPWCDSPEFLKKFEGFFTDGEGKTFLKLQSLRPAGETAIAKFEGIEDVNAASSLRNKVIFIDRNWVELPKGSYFEQDLLGLTVKDDENGTVYGTIGEVGRTGANDIYRVDKDGKEVWIPAIKDVIKSTEPENGVMLITPLKGLFDDED